MELRLTILLLIISTTLYNQQVVINEVMVGVISNVPNASNNDNIIANSLYNVSGLNSPNNKEWIELYNTDPCDSADISCFILANYNGPQEANTWGYFRFPENTKIPPLGFIIVGGNDAEVPYNNFNITDYYYTNYVSGGSRWYLKNYRSWVGLYDNNGWPIDALCWGASMDEMDNYSEFTTNITVDSYCTGHISLIAAADFPNKTIINFHVHESARGGFKRKYDGANELVYQTDNFTPGTCNSSCVDKLPIPSFEIQDATCKSSNGSISFSFSEDGCLPYIFSWDFSGVTTDNPRNNLNSQQFEFFVKDKYRGCMVDIYYPTVNVYDPAIDFDIMFSPDDCGQGKGELGITNVQNGTKPYKYEWSTSDTNRYITNLFKGNYTITITDNDSCQSLKSIYLKNECIVSAPNTITPNNDGVNDTWEIENLDFYPDHKIEIFDRYGHQVYEAINYKNDWYGQKKDGSLLPAATYYYIIYLEQGFGSLKGSITIVN